jgi:uncharacterized glyoxalase superfamily protein PhnB
MHLSEIEFILYVADQSRSRDFYQKVLQSDPSLDVPGMTEFKLGPGVKLGLMPENGIAKILSDKMPHPATGNGIPRCELYLVVDDVATAMKRAVQSGARLVSETAKRDWDQTVGYVSDPDGHIIAFAQIPNPKS